MASVADLERWFSRARLARFVESAASNEAALELYAWNARVSADFMEVIHHVEVLLRNALHAVLAEAYPPEPPWYLNPVVIRARGIEDAEKAMRRLREQGKEVTEGRIIAAVPFGFWDALFTKKYEDLWRAAISRAFAVNGPKKRHTVADLTSRVRNFRNALAHHDRLLELDLVARHADLLTLAGWIDPKAREWIESRSRVLESIEARPGE